ncbi:uroporphyrinogen decarboxylase [Mycolicibacterium goodii]|uniref:Uroporphyrinogen decarboxylase n=1 Tax=Mycolicibacterium goodii TaxID=134601 RepID=A0ABS6HXU5_MYCGD|nr:uroporphyrinogen decarboxylase [Mycolicibacterium goodii]OKH63296.1 uroporphyrinogen decarboxylase [Mycobacterium sp. SWH-M5]MBU8810144.1 uroporphyrinogen decarboxylase [Mycolicibacterium goodii]MBU8819713.1 uroporphyrinogen decarboxylase [Mycolicibacterium goodii]MBU8827489.1 uroporphyrinogen decarboxylase [Mycolicibacterium goodii]MBU8832360.1 uroporphyrinogen decarboxylase [Mycolicibacterium goodii]
MNTRRELPDSPYLAAAGGRSPHRVPVWFMRQAGRSLPEYRELRAQHRMLQACFDPELVCEITMQPVRRHKVDAAILFSDIVVPLKAAGIGLDIVPDVGPVIDNPIRTVDDVRAMPALEPDQVAPVSEAVKLLTTELGDVPLIGFAGAPFTLASYLVEGGPSRHHERTKAMMLGESATWHALMTALTDLTIAFLQAQVAAGVDALQVFDSWAGTLSLADYREYVLPHSGRVFATMAAAGIPMTHFGVGTAELLGAMSEALAPGDAPGDARVVGVDWRTSLADAAGRVRPGTALQGNLDPVVLLAGWPVVETAVRRVVEDGRAAVAAGAAGHIFNLGHGVLPATDPGIITDAVALVHSL